MGGDHTCHGCGQLEGTGHLPSCVFASVERRTVRIEDTMHDPAPTVRPASAREVAEAENAYLRCEGCGCSLPITNTPAGERCPQCGGVLLPVVEVDEPAAPAIGSGALVEELRSIAERLDRGGRRVETASDTCDEVEQRVRALADRLEAERTQIAATGEGTTATIVETLKAAGRADDERRSAAGEGEAGSRARASGALDDLADELAVAVAAANSAPHEAHAEELLRVAAERVAAALRGRMAEVRPLVEGLPHVCTCGDSPADAASVPCSECGAAVYEACKQGGVALEAPHEARAKLAAWEARGCSSGFDDRCRFESALRRLVRAPAADDASGVVVVELGGEGPPEVLGRVVEVREPAASYPDRIRAGEVQPWIGAPTEAEGARRSAAVVDDELATLAADDPRREGLGEQRQAWLDRAAALESRIVTGAPWPGAVRRALDEAGGRIEAHGGGALVADEQDPHDWRVELGGRVLRVMQA